MKTVRRLLLSMSMSLPMFALVLPGASAAAGKGRAVTAAEQRSFELFAATRFPTARPMAPSVVWPAGARSATLQGALDLPAQRGLRNLCRITTVHFELQNEWRETARAQRIWLNRANCAPRGAQVALKLAIPDSEAILALERHQALLARARLIMAGDSRCAAERSSRFYLTSLDLGSTRSGNENLLMLNFASDRDVALSILARRSGADYDAWEVACIKPSLQPVVLNDAR